MILVLTNNQGLICYLSSYYAYEVNNNLIIFNNNKIKSDIVIKFDFYEDFQSATDQINYYLNSKR
jgi:hypothetical protein